MSWSRQAFLTGVRDVAPILIGVVPFGMIYGVAAVGVGLGKPVAILMSVFVFAGAAQIAAVDLMADGAPFMIVVLTAWVINARFVMYSASLAPHLADSPLGWRIVCSYLLTDQAYAFSVLRFDGGEALSKRSYYIGAAVTLWLVWQVSTAMGVLLGAAIPQGWSLDFAIPLTFLALLVPALRNRAAVAAAVAGAGTALAARDLPLNTGLLAAAVAGLAVGSWVDWRAR